MHYVAPAMIDLFVSIVNYSESRIVALLSIVILKWQYRSALAGMYSVLADETKDCSKKEQLSLVRFIIYRCNISER